MSSITYLCPLKQRLSRKKSNMRIFILSLFLSIFSQGNTQTVIDTVSFGERTILIMSNRTWEYIEDANFDGVMNLRLHEEIMGDTNLNFIQNWDHEVCYTSNLSNNINLFKDTVWLCLEDSLSDKFVMPFDGRITSHYGWRRGRNHNGTDIDLVTGDTVRSAWSGKIRYAKYNTSGFGNLVIIRHENGLETFYAHLSRLIAVPNQVVEAGDVIGLGGNTGHSTGSHLHFEVRFYDVPFDSEKIIDYKKKEVINENLIVSRSLFRPGGGSKVSSGSVAGAKYYRVRSGDTLGRIAARNHTSVSRMCQLNGIRPTTILQIGRNLRIR